MEPRIWTIIVMLTAGTLVIAWDIYVAFFNKQDNRLDTISGITLGWSMKMWGLPFAFGVLGGHLFMTGSILTFVSWWGITILASLAIGLSVLGYFITKNRTPWRTAVRGFGLILLGLVMGHLFWPQ